MKAGMHVGKAGRVENQEIDCGTVSPSSALIAHYLSTG